MNLPYVPRGRRGSRKIKDTGSEHGNGKDEYILKKGICPKCGSSSVYLLENGIVCAGFQYVRRGEFGMSSTSFDCYHCTCCGYFENYMNKRWLLGPDELFTFSYEKTISESGPCGLRGEVFSRELIPDGAGEYAEIFHNSPDTGDLMNLACISYSFQLLYIKIFEKFSDPDYLTYYRYKYFFPRNYRVEIANEK